MSYIKKEKLVLIINFSTISMLIHPLIRSGEFNYEDLSAAVSKVLHKTGYINIEYIPYEKSIKLEEEIRNRVPNIETILINSVLKPFSSNITSGDDTAKLVVRSNHLIIIIPK